MNLGLTKRGIIIEKQDRIRYNKEEDILIDNFTVFIERTILFYKITYVIYTIL